MLVRYTLTPGFMLYFISRKIINGIDRFVVFTDFKMQMHAVGHACGAHMRDGLPLIHPVAFLDQQLAAVPVIGEITVIVPDSDQKAVAAIPVGFDDLAAVGGGDLLSVSAGDINSLVII